MRIGVPRITRIFAMALTVAMAAPSGTRAHEGIGGKPAHMAMLSDGLEQWHEHTTVEGLEAEREENRQWQCADRLAQWRRYTNGADSADA